MPLILIPFVFSTCAGAYVALGRIGAFLTAEELGAPYAVEEGSKWAVCVEGDFVWEETAGGEEKNGEGKKGKREAGKKGKREAEAPSPEPAFELRGLRMRVEKGAFVGIVGRVGAGKSSVLQAMIGEIRKTRGEATSCRRVVRVRGADARCAGGVRGRRGVRAAERVDHERDGAGERAVWAGGRRGAVPRGRARERADVGPGDAPAGGPHEDRGEGHQSQGRHPRCAVG